MTEEIRHLWNSKVKDLLVQGSFLQILHLENSCFSWKNIIYELPRGVLQFALNASTDCLPTLVNLGRWRLRSANNTKCQLCQNSETLHHVLNFCKPMLDQGRYTWRHDSILSYLVSLFKQSNDFKLYFDLGSKPREYMTTIPPEVLPTSQRPDLVIHWPNLDKICIFELTIPFDTNIHGNLTNMQVLSMILPSKGLKSNFLLLN